MTNLQHTTPKSASPLVDDRYIAWFIAESESERALQAWFDAPQAHRRTAYVAYCEALNREEAAAIELRRVCESGADVATARMCRAA